MNDVDRDPLRNLPKRLGVIGGGTAGYFAALAIKARFPAIDVSVVESKDVPIIGVGEATTTLMPPFLHRQLGLDIVSLFREVGTTFKMGIKFEWGAPESDYFFTYPFGDADPLAAYAMERDLRNQSIVSMLMCRDQSPVIKNADGTHRSLLPRLKFAYHLNNAPFVSFLAREALRRGIRHEEMTIESVVPHQGKPGIQAIRGRDGRVLEYDFFVDATGFRSLLIESALGSPFQSYASTLFCDRAVVATVPQSGPVRPYTTAETMNNGWCWRIPVVGEDHRGYVHASEFVSVDEATHEMRTRNPGMGDPWVVKFRSGRHRDFWLGNTVAMGNAYGFVEPLESTALHMVIIEIGYLLAGLEELQQESITLENSSFPAYASEAVGSHWDYLRWFLGIHYKFNKRLDTRFWKTMREDVNVSGFAELLERYYQHGPYLSSQGSTFRHGDPAFGYHGAMMLLLGQHAPSLAELKKPVSDEAWASRVSAQKAYAASALPQRQAIEALLAHPEMLQEFAESPDSWCLADADRVSGLTSRRPVHPKQSPPSTLEDEPLLRALISE